MRVAVVLLVLVACVGAANAQISPGELAEAHAFMEGMKNCLKCHKLGAGPSAEKCLECHKEIAVGIENKHGYHYRSAVVAKKSCFECHNDHAGRDFELVHWPDGIDAFEHSETGYLLHGAHARLKCRECHKSKFIVEDIAKYQESIDLDRTFLGLGERCLGCHADAHRDQLGENCLNCHDYHAWRPAPQFDHSRTAFALTGRHRTVECAKCHPKLRVDERGKRRHYVKYKGVARTCASCHKDVHGGKLGADCERCHRTSGWLDIAAENFDHSRTRFPLKGLHARVRCEQCHGQGTQRRQLTFGRCLDCHDDRHRGQFATRAGGDACENCHNENGFVPALFTLADHDKTRYRLEGAHLAQPCIACHTQVHDSRGEPYRRYVFSDLTCTGCHEDVHLGQFERHGKRKRCEDCHHVSFWNDLNFDHNRDSSYPLIGAHASVRCEGCHKTVREGGKQVVRYRPIKQACKTCHDVQPAPLN